jgi:transposase
MCPTTGPTVTSQKEATTMVIVGAGVHECIHTSAAVDEVGRKLGEKVVEAPRSGHGEAVMWVRESDGAEVVRAMEDCGHLLARLNQDSPTAGQQATRVPPKLMAQTRASARTCGESDPIDAFVVARRSASGAKDFAAIHPQLQLPRHLIRMTLPGCGELTAAKLVGKAVGVTRLKARPPLPGISGWPRYRCGQLTPPGGCA